jgi:hypothetical protein
MSLGLDLPEANDDRRSAVAPEAGENERTPGEHRLGAFINEDSLVDQAVGDRDPLRIQGEFGPDGKFEVSIRVRQK